MTMLKRNLETERQSVDREKERMDVCMYVCACLGGIENCNEVTLVMSRCLRIRVQMAA